MTERYKNSEEMLARALQTIPLGTQTFSKSKIQFPYNVSPYFIDKALGSRVWDIDGNEYIDFINSLAAVTLGYKDPEVTQAVKEQLEKGTIFSLPHPIEVLVSEKIVELVPCAEMVRFGKSGSDATAGAIRVSRAYTGRDHVAVCGYHGWQDWYIGSTARRMGVPSATRELTHVFNYNDLVSLEQIFKEYPEQVAAVILEPMTSITPENGFLEGLKEITHKNGAVLIFDETVTGFRFARGGAQEYFKVTPDLAAFGKGLANGYPVSAVAGKADIMKLMEEVFFSFTFGGETLSLAAAYATMQKLQKEPVIEKLYQQGRKVMDGVKKLIIDKGLTDVMEIKGNPTWSFLIIKDSVRYTQWQIKTLFLQEAFARGILILTSHNMSYAHSDDDIRMLLSVYDEVFSILKEAIEENKLDKLLRCQPLEPVFKIR